MDQFHNSIPHHHQQSLSFDDKLRNAMRTRIYAVLKHTLSSKTNGHVASHDKFIALTNLVESKLKQITTSWKDYCDLRFLEHCIWSIISDSRRLNFAATTAPPPTEGSHYLHVGANVSSVPYQHMVDVSAQPNITPVTYTTPLITMTTAPPSNGFQTPSHMHMGFSGYSMSNADSFGSSNLHRVVTSSGSMPDKITFHPNPMLRVDTTTFTSNQPNLQTPILKRQPLHHLLNKSFQSASTYTQQMAQGSQQLLFNHGFHQQAPAIENQGQHSQQLYPEHLQYNDAYQTSLATPVQHGPPSVDFYKEAIQQQATYGFNPSKLQYQSASFHSNQLSSSPSFPPHPHQEQSSSVPVQREPSPQYSTQTLVNNDREGEHTGANLCQPEVVYHCGSAHISSQAVSPRSTTERNHIPEVNDTLSKQESGDRRRDYMNQRKWLLFLFHARDCSAAEGKCVSNICFSTKKLLEHMKSCKIPDCTVPLCPQTHELILHYKKCTNKSCPVCVFVKNFRKKEKARISLLGGAKRDSASLKCHPRSESLEPKQAYNKGGSDTPSVDDDLQPPIKRLKTEHLSQNATPETERKSVPVFDVVCKSPEKPVEVMPMDIDVSDASGIPITAELEKPVDEDIPKDSDVGESTMDDKTICLSTQEKSECMNEIGVPKEENVKADASNMEISSLVELFTPEQAKEHMRGLRQWVGQSKAKAGKSKAIRGSISTNACQLCAVERLPFEPVPIYCSPCGVRIKRKALHYSVTAGESRHYVCATCYNVARDNSVAVDGTSILKARFEKKKNDEQACEGWVQCDKCEAWQHQICALFNNRTNHGEATKYTCPNCYIQEVEQGERKPLPQSAIPGAQSLPVTTLSNHIEQRLFKNLEKERQERATFLGKSYEEVPGAEPLAVRVVASVDKVLEVKKNFRELFQEENYPSEFPYKSKAILLFQKIEGVEVLLFGMFVQEYGSKCGPPNQRRVYLSYLDSVKYFRPEVRTVSGEALRTFVYHEILIGYLDYCKKRGYTSCYIWACPPLKGEDYILYCHPEIQKTPKTDKLKEWYLAMLRKASKEDVVVECSNLYDQFFVQPRECRANITAARLPYFDGDYWPGAADDLIKQMSREDDGKTLNRKGLTKKVISKRDLREVSQLDLPVNASKDRLIMQKLGETISPIKEDFIMVHLQHCCKHCCTIMVSGNRWVCNHCKNFQICDKCNEVEQKRAEKKRHPINQKEKHALFPVAIKDIPIEIEDKDDNLESEFFDNRQAFLGLCQGNNYQYDTLRRAKHSSMMILYHLHNPTAPAFVTTCAICQQEVENGQGWHCEVCTGYDVCNACFSKTSIDHPHKLISRSSDRETSVQQNEQANQPNNQLQHEKIKDLLLHIVECRYTQCQYQGCRRMKWLAKHCMACKISTGGCSHCKRFWGLVRHHARGCRDSQCTVLKCRDFRAISSRKQQQSDQRRRAAVMEMMRERAAEATKT